MPATSWYLLGGALLFFVALAGTVLKRLPLSTSLLYLIVGLALGSHGAQVFSIDLTKHALLLERFAEVAVLLSLFSSGLKVGADFDDARWKLPLKLASLSMLLTAGGIALTAKYLLGLPLPVAIVLGGILAPTDPVLASDVQLSDHRDRDRVRFALTGEAGLNDATASPVVLLGLGLMGLHPLGAFGWHFVLVDVIWSFVGGAAIGWFIGHFVARFVVRLRTRHKTALGMDEFLALGVIALAYGLASIAVASGFLAVFAAGLALRRFERASAHDRSSAIPSLSRPLDPTKPEHAPAAMTRGVLRFNEQLEHVAEMILVVIVAASLRFEAIPRFGVAFVAVVLLVIRPLSVVPVLLGKDASPLQRRLIGWFGIRGIGSIYYLLLALDRGLPLDSRDAIIALTLLTVMASICLHGVSVTPLMKRYEDKKA